MNTTQKILAGLTLSGLMSCGLPSERQGRSPDSASENNPTKLESESRETASELTSTQTAFDESSVVLLQITVPYCRNDVPETPVAKYCSGTVISNRYVLTAAHCFATECPTNGTLYMRDIKIPSAPPAAGVDLKSHDWSKNALSPINLALVAGGKYPVGYTKKTKKGIFLTSYTFFDTTVDQAILDFGENQLSQAQYRESPLADPSTMVSTEQLFVAGYGSLEGRNFIRTKRPSFPVKPNFGFFSALSNSVNAGTDRQGVIRPYVPASANYPAGCHGDSGGPLVMSNSKKIFGVAALRYIQSSDNPDPQTCRPGDTVTFSLIIPEMIDKAIATMTTAIESVNLGIDLRNPQKPGDVTGVENESRFISSLVAPHAVTPTTTVSPTAELQTVGWARIPSSSGSTLIPSYYAGGVLDAIAATPTGSGANSATWTATGLKPGRYKVELFYYTHPQNAPCVAVQYKLGDSTFGNPSVRLNQANGTLTLSTSTTSYSATKIGSPIDSFQQVVANLTPTSASTLPVAIGATSNIGSISVKISDRDCNGGRIIADTIRLTWVSSK